MTSMSQPLAPCAAAGRVPPRDGETTRLLLVWATLAQKAAAASAHELPDEMSLLRSQFRIEQVLAKYLSPVQMDELLIWEASLIHDDAGGTQTACLSCRKAAKSLPLDIPLPIQPYVSVGSGGRR